MVHGQRRQTDCRIGRPNPPLSSLPLLACLQGAAQPTIVRFTIFISSLPTIPHVPEIPVFRPLVIIED